MRPQALLFILTVILASCDGRQTSNARREVDSLNERAYEWRYRDVDSLRTLASIALERATASSYADGQAEALNHMVFERFQQMDFDSALVLAGRVGAFSSSSVEKLVAEVMQMRIAQRTSDNLAFFRHRGRALRHIDRINRHASSLTPHEQRRFSYGRSDFHIVSSTYFYYLGQNERAIAEICEAAPYSQVSDDGAQWLYYCYMRGSGGLSQQTDAAAIACEEFDYLMKCFLMARYEGFVFFEANAEQSLATLFADSARLAVVSDRMGELVGFLHQIYGTEDTPMQLAESALAGFVAYDDLYQEACALRTLGELSFDAGRFDDAIDYYASALACVNFHHQCYYAPDSVLTSAARPANAAAAPPAGAPVPDLLQVFDPLNIEESVERRWMRSSSVKTVPEWIAGIRQQLSVAFSALDMKAESDYNRNIYLDLLDVTREDAELESRAAELRAESLRLRWMAVGVAILAVLIALLIVWQLRAWRRRTDKQKRLLRQKFATLHAEAQREEQALAEEHEQLLEQQAATELRLRRDKEQNVEKRAKLSLAQAITPYLDRIIREVESMKRRGTTSPAALTYITELTDHINGIGDLLTQWIQMEQGQLSLQLSTFPLAPLFDAIAKGHYPYDQKGLTLRVEPTELTVKADRALTLFMLNTLADNARKFTPAGGSVTITATAGENEDGSYVELSVADTGCGISAEDIDLLLNHKTYDAGKIGSLTRETNQLVYTNEPTRIDESPNSSIRISNSPKGVSQDSQKGFGFGLMNCKGIIEKFRKTNPLFRVCRIGIESRVGEGSRFWFRLPRGLAMVALLLFAGTTEAAETTESNGMTKAYALADSVYCCNIQGRYADALGFADAALRSFGCDSLGRMPVLRDDGREPAELQWWNRREQVDYSLLLGLRNEVAVAALALHDWSLYRYNNRLYTQLYKLTNQDASLETYCRETEQSQRYERWALLALVILVVLGIVAVWLFSIHPRIVFRRNLARLSAQRLQQMQTLQEARRQQQQGDLEQAEDEHRRRLFEEGRLHVQNQIIDNALSTIKHETMFYPGRIRQLVERMQAGTDEAANLQTLSETVDYYREVYALLCAQASGQSAALNFRRRTLEVAPLLAAAAAYAKRSANRKAVPVEVSIDNALPQGFVRGDADLLAMLFNRLIDAELDIFVRKNLPCTDGKAAIPPMPFVFSVKADARFARFSLYVSFTDLSDDELHDLFMPHHDGIDFLVARQIIREHDTFMGHPGCRINAEHAPSFGHIVWFTVPLHQP